MRRFPRHCCQRCGEQVGYIGRLMMALRLPVHDCPPWFERYVSGRVPEEWVRNSILAPKISVDAITADQIRADKLDPPAREEP